MCIDNQDFAPEKADRLNAVKEPLPFLPGSQDGWWIAVFLESKEELVLIALDSTWGTTTSINLDRARDQHRYNSLSLLGRVYDALSRPRMVKVPVPPTHSIRSALKC